MLVSRGFGLGGLGVGDTPAAPAPLTHGYCFEGGAWRWTTAEQCSKPLLPGGAPVEKPGFCWIRQSPPEAFPGYWQRASAQGCAHAPPPSPPTVPAGYCQNPTTGRWGWVLADQCAGPVVPGTGVGPDRDHRPGGNVYQPPGGTPNVIDVINGSPMTRSMVERLFDSTWKMIVEREALALKALTPSLVPCPAGTEWSKGGGSGCYNYGPTSLLQTIPGSFEVFGVPFNIAEPGITKSPRFERTYTPNNEQRILVEARIIKRSGQLLTDALYVALRKRGIGLTNPTDLAKAVNALSVEGALSLLPRWKMVVPGMAISSAPPKATELSTSGGFSKWIKRGFLISLDITEGKDRLSDDATCPMACVSALCRCGDKPWPACIGSGVPVNYDTQDTSGGCFWWHVEIMPDGQFKLIGKHDDPDWLAKAMGPITKFMAGLGNFICQNMPMLQTQTASVVAEKCVDKDGKPCTKGAAGCTCVSPSAAVQGGVGLFNFIGGKLCQGWLAEHAQDPTQPMPPIPDPAPISATASWLSYVPWIVGGLAIGAGASVFSRR